MRVSVSLALIASFAVACGGGGVGDGGLDASTISSQEPDGSSGLGGTTGQSPEADAITTAGERDTGQTAGGGGVIGGNSGAAGCCTGDGGGIGSARSDGSGETDGSTTVGADDAGTYDEADRAAADRSVSDAPLDVIPVTVPTCPFPLSTPPKEGCVESSAALASTAMAIQVGGYQCTAATNATTTRIRACVWIQDNPCVIDDEIRYCAVVEMTPETLASLPVGSEVPLAGVTTFTIPNLYDISYEWSLNPNDVSFVPADPVAGLQRVWMEKGCFCHPTLNSSSQTLTGSLRVESKTSGRLAARVVLRATGVIAPTTSVQETAVVDVAFDVVPGVLLPDP